MYNAMCHLQNRKWGGTFMRKFKHHLQDEALGILVCNPQDGVLGKYLLRLFLLLDV